MYIIDCIIWDIYQELLVYKAEEKLHLGVWEQKMMNSTVLHS
jgi:hypothetical protein